MIALDAMGGDNAPHVTVRGAIAAAKCGVTVGLFGDEELLKKFDQIVIEFHWMINHLNSDSFTTMLNALEKISSTHKVVNIHANNYAHYEIVANCPIPDVIEVSYARKSSYSFIEKTLVPDFNVKNYSEHPEISLQFPLIGQ